jgi:hypothetical protein
MSSSKIPVRRNLTLAYALSLITGLLMAVVSLAGLLFQTSLYPTSELRQTFIANEVVNLFIGLPVLLVSMWLARRGRLAGLLLWPGALLYVLYNYIAYVIGMPLGWISLVYLALVLLSAYVIIFLLRAIDKSSVQQQIAGFVPVKLSGWVLVLLGCLFFLRALSLIIQASKGQMILPMSGLGVLVADIILSACWIVGGVLLLLHKPLGYASGLGLLFSGSMLFIALILFLMLGPLLTEAPFAPADVMMVFSLGMISFLPFFLFLRGVISIKDHHDAA